MLKKIDKYSVLGEYHQSNKIIQGDNTEVLEHLVGEYRGKVKCIYIDPPYNNGEAYTHYNDQFNHDEWLEKIIATLEKLKPLLRKDGSIWISIDDNEVHYLNVSADKVFGRRNFVNTIIWQQRTTRENS
jgi:adenine-specific DNA-methyltransferase